MRSMLLAAALTAALLAGLGCEKTIHDVRIGGSQPDAGAKKTAHTMT